MPKQKSSINKETLAFRPRARLLKMLGDQLIGSHRLAVFELVKNAYDADAKKVIIQFEGIETNNPFITIYDDGEGMTVDTIRNIWLVPADNHREGQREKKKRTKLGRLPLGEKGLGRFAVHKLGDEIELVTRAKNQMECLVRIKWSDLIKKEFLSEALVTIENRKPAIFKNNQTGTLIKITDLNQKKWTRGDLRKLYRQVTSISSPFEEPKSFKTVLKIPGNESYFEDLPNIEDILERAIWTFNYRFEKGKLYWKYKFHKIPKIKLNSREVENKEDILLINSSKKKVVDDFYTKGIGPIWGDLYVFDRDREILKLLPNPQFITEFLNENGGIRVYRDGIRVYNYGEQGDDWLGLDLRRVNVPTRSISRNIILGTINLSIEHSFGLHEKTNREGFIENEANSHLREMVLGIISKFEVERKLDKDNIRKLTGKASDPEIHRIREPVQKLREVAKKQEVFEKLEPYIKKIEIDYEEMQETMLHAGLSGLSLGIIFHEIHRGVKALAGQIIGRKFDAKNLENHAKALVQTLDGFSTLLRRDPKKVHSIRKVVKQIRSYNILRFENHHVAIQCPLLDDETLDFEGKFSLGLVLGALNNILDNSFYWLQVRWSEKNEKQKPKRKIYIGPSMEFENGPALIIADNGPGFQDDPDRLARPFFTRKPNGMGLGLYYANMVMELNGGKLLFPDPKEVDLPNGFNGAVVAFVFKRKK